MSEPVSNECSAPTRGRTLDYAAAVYDWLSPLMTFGHEKRLGQTALGLLALKGDEKIIDIGCGTGTLTLEAAQRLSAENGGMIVGIDAAAKMIQLARKKRPGSRRFDLRLPPLNGWAMTMKRLILRCQRSSFIISIWN